jgi:hypothetical protein
MVLATGRELLVSEGMRCGLDHLTFGRVFELIEERSGRRITLASVYDRLWSSQEQFQWEVLAGVIEEAGTIDERTRQRVAEVLAAAERTTPEGRLDAVRALCQLAVEQHVLEASKRQHYRIAVAAVGAVSSSYADDVAPHVQRVRDALHGYLEQETEQYLELYNLIGAHLGFRMRHPLELRHLVLAIGAFGDGIALRLNFFPEYAARIAVPEGGGAPGESLSSLAAVGVEAVARAMLELDPDWPGPDAP